MTRYLCLVVAVALAASCSSPERASFGAIVEADELGRRCSDKSPANRLIILDVRDNTAYSKGHFAGAVRVDPETWKDESLAADTGLDHVAAWHARLGALGVSGREPVVIYDDGRMTEAARVWFIFQHFGVRDAAVVNGGYPALEPLLADGRIPVSREATSPKRATFRSSPDSKGGIGLVERQRVRESIDRGDAQVFDARTPEEYAGKDRKSNPRGGHLPKAINLSHKQLLDASGRLKPPDQLATLFRQSGFERGRPIITHCQSGGRASLAALAAARAGYGPVMNYYLSFGDWAADATCPLKSGSEP